MEKIFCLHRIHDGQPLSPAHAYQKRLGLSISLTDLENHLKAVASTTASRFLITIDDGHRDVLKLIPLAKELKLNPIIFLTGRQLRGDARPLPLTSLYTWCGITNNDPNNIMDELGFDRLSLKHLRQAEQERLMSNGGIPLDAEKERMLDQTDIAYLVSHGFRIGYHGPEHCDLRIIPHDELDELFEEDIQLFKNAGHFPELAWPEGWWDDEISHIAVQRGFRRQYGLSSDRFVDQEQIIWPRIILK